MISDADAVRWAVRVMPQLAAKADGRPDELGQQYLDRLTALADRLDGGVIVPRKDYDAILKQAAHYFTPKPDSDRFCAECGEYLTSPMHNRAMLDASEAK